MVEPSNSLARYPQPGFRSRIGAELGSGAELAELGSPLFIIHLTEAEAA
jgi:hypothetical protein